jgi:hypothetical protein
MSELAPTTIRIGAGAGADGVGVLKSPRPPNPIILKLSGKCNNYNNIKYTFFRSYCMK